MAWEERNRQDFNQTRHSHLSSILPLTLHLLDHFPLRNIQIRPFPSDSGVYSAHSPAYPPYSTYSVYPVPTERRRVFTPHVERDPRGTGIDTSRLTCGFCALTSTLPPGSSHLNHSSNDYIHPDSIVQSQLMAAVRVLLPAFHQTANVYRIPTNQTKLAPTLKPSTTCLTVLRVLLPARSPVLRLYFRIKAVSFSMVLSAFSALLTFEVTGLISLVYIFTDLS
jgi:hypothetical protein